MGEPIRILNAVGRMGAGGMEALIMNIYRNIDREKVQFDFLSHNGNGGIYEDEIRQLGGRIYEMPVIRTFTKTYYWKFFEYVSALKKFFEEHPEYHVLHGHMTNTAAIYMPIAKKYGNVTCCIAHSHSSQARPGVVGKVTNLLQRRIPMVATDYFACSEAAAHWFYSDDDIKNGKVRIINNGVDLKDFRFDEKERGNIRRELGIHDQIVIGHVGRFTIQKNQSFLVDVFNDFHKQHTDSILFLTGDGEKRPEVEEKVKGLGLQDSVKFLGVRDDVHRLLLAMDIFVLPSIVEGLPVVAVEAQASGLPVLTSEGVSRETNITGNVQFIDLDSGAGLWAERISGMLSGFVRKDMTDIMRANGYDIAETAAWLQNFYIRKHYDKE
jgi:glycosyltransferase involved in cell wall biosynthesis